MVGKTKAATAEERRRLVILKENCPCLPCLLDTGRVRLPTIQHVSRGYKRKGHEFTYPSCQWHHLGSPPAVGGPALSEGRKPFERHYGPEENLVELADLMVAWYEHDPWIDYNVPTSLVGHLQSIHREGAPEMGPPEGH